ncbi:MAG: UDP-N-acetylglucosamine pyrophosphorylase [Clostridium sp.]
MNFKLSVYDLSKALKALEEKYTLQVVIKSTLSGGWMTIMGEAKVESEAVLSAGCHGKDINILELRVNSDNNEGSLVKLTGAKNKEFTVDVAPTRFRELSNTSITLNQIKINNEECKLRIGEDIIFTIKDNADKVIALLNSLN